MNQNKLIPGCLIGAISAYLLLETLGAIQPKQYHIEIGTNQPSEIDNVAIHSPLTAFIGSATVSSMHFGSS